MKMMYKKAVKVLPKLLVVACLLFGIVAGHQQKVEAAHYTAWHIVYVGPIQEKEISYGGGKRMMQIYQNITYRRYYIDDRGRKIKEDNTVQKNLGLRSIYAPK